MDLDPQFAALLDSNSAPPSKPNAPALASSDLDPAFQAMLSTPADTATDQNTQIAQSVTPQGSNRAMTWLKNAPATAGGELYRLYKNVTGQQMDPLQQAVFNQAKQASPGVAPLTDVLATAPVAMGVGEALPAMGLARLAASAPALGAVQGGIQGALTANPGDRWQQGAIGAATGAALPMIGGAIGKLASGVARTPEAEQLVSQGVQLPVGMMSPSGAVNKVEQALTNLPFVGSKIANARAAVPAQVTERMVQDAVAPGAALTPGLGINDAVSELKSGYDSAYHAAIGGYPGVPAIAHPSGPIPLTQAFTDVANTARAGLTAKASSRTRTDPAGSTAGSDRCGTAKRAGIESHRLAAVS